MGKKNLLVSVICLISIYIVMMSCGDPFGSEDPAIYTDSTKMAIYNMTQLAKHPSAPDTPEPKSWYFVGTGSYTFTIPASSSSPAKTCSFDDDKVELVVWPNGEAYLDDYHTLHNSDCVQLKGFGVYDFSGKVRKDPPNEYVAWEACNAGSGKASGTVLLEDIGGGIFNRAVKGGAECIDNITYSLTFTLQYVGEYPGEDGDIIP